MYYLNYLSIFFGAALAAAALIASRDRRRVAIGFTAMAITAGLMALPQVGTMLHVHLPGSGSSQQSSAIVAAARMFHGVFISEAILPWRPIAMVFAMVVAVPLSCVNCDSPHGSVLGAHAPSPARCRSSCWLSSWYWASPAASRDSGQTKELHCSESGSRDRLGVWVPAFISQSRQVSSVSGNVRVGSLGANDLLRREGTAKGGMNDHPEEVSEFVRAEAGPGVAPFSRMTQGSPTSSPATSHL